MELYWGSGDHLRKKPAFWLLLHQGRMLEETVAPPASIASGATDKWTVAWGRDERHRTGAFPLDASDLGTATLTVEIAGEHITLATVAQDAETGLYRKFIGMPAS
jgi:hypothetical protein